jgi:hypothetical protein
MSATVTVNVQTPYTPNGTSIAKRSRARLPTSRHARGTTSDVSRASAASTNSATAHHRWRRHSTTPHRASANASASARLARVLMIRAGLSATVTPIHHGARTLEANRDNAMPAAPTATAFTASIAHTVGSPAGNGATSAG